MSRGGAFPLINLTRLVRARRFITVKRSHQPDTWPIIHRHCKATIIRGLLGAFDLQVNVKSRGKNITAMLFRDIYTYFNL